MRWDIIQSRCAVPRARAENLGRRIKTAVLRAPAQLWRGIEVVITSLTRNQVYRKVAWVRIPPSPPLKKCWGQDLKAHKVIYNNPILKWCQTNMGVQTDHNGNIVPVKTNRRAKG